MNIQFMTGIYAMLTFLASYMCKPQHTVSELIRNASKESYGRNVREKLRGVGNVFITKRKVS